MASMVFATAQPVPPDQLAEAAGSVPVMEQPESVAPVAPADEPVITAAAVEPAPEQPEPPRGHGRRRRAHSESTGQFMADDPATPDVNEAYQ